MSNKYAGTQTKKNLMVAFSGESEAENKYTYFASKAKKEGNKHIATLFFCDQFPFFAHLSENKQSYFASIRQCYDCGKKRRFPVGKRLGFPGKRKGEKTDMKNNNQINVPQAREAMDKFKMQAAQEVGVNLTNGYNGHLTSREAGSVGGQMVKNNCPARTMKFDRHNRIAMGHVQAVQYITTITI